MPVLDDMISYDVAYHLRQGALYDEPEHVRMAEALLSLKAERLVEVPLSYEEDEALCFLEHLWHEEQLSQGHVPSSRHWAHHTPLLPMHYAQLAHESQDRRIGRSWHATLPTSWSRLEWLERLWAEMGQSLLWQGYTEERYGPIIARLLERAKALLAAELRTPSAQTLRVAETPIPTDESAVELTA